MVSRQNSKPNPILQNPKRGSAVTIQSIAEKVGVSNMTVSNILNCKAGRSYRESTRARVQAAAREMGYRQNRAAQAIRTGKSGVIGYVAETLSYDLKVCNQAAYAVVTGMSHYLTKIGRHVSVIPIEELKTSGPRRLPDILREQFFDGVVMQVRLKEKEAQEIAAGGVPCIFFDSGIDWAHNCLIRDEKKAFHEAFERLFAQGHRRIAFVYGRALNIPEKELQHIHYSFKLRRDMYLRLIRERGLTPTLVKGDTMQEVADSIRAANPTAVILDSETTLILGALYGLGLRVPQDISLASVALETSMTGIDAISGMNFDRLAAGHIVGRMIMDATATPEGKVASVVINPEWVDFGTVGPVPKALARSGK